MDLITALNQLIESAGYWADLLGDNDDEGSNVDEIRCIDTALDIVRTFTKGLVP